MLPRHHPDRIRIAFDDRRLAWVNKPNLRAHEDGVISCISHFLARGLPVAAGWRSWEQLKASGISPDGMVFLERSPYGPTWAYFEYERTARGEARVGRKLNGDGCPVLIVCWNDDAESVFQRLGSGMGISLLTTTIKRLEEHGPLGNFGCWSMYGQPARIGQGRRASWLLARCAHGGVTAGSTPT